MSTARKTNAPPPRPAAGAGGLVLRIVALLCVIALATWGAHEVRDALNLQIRPENEQQVHRAVMIGMVAYVLLLAMPFVPGAEIGLALLTAFGAAIAPLVYAGTVISMLLAYAIGSLLPATVLARILSALHLRKAAALAARAAPLTREERLALLLQGAPPRLMRLALHHRYIALALAVNLPGNVVVGGGGGIMLMVGMSGLFAPFRTLLTIAIAVSPVPLLVMVTGL